MITRLLLIFVGIALATQGKSQTFVQNFSTSSSVSAYHNANPSSNQFTWIGGPNQINYQINQQRLRVQKAGNGNQQGGIVRNTNFSGNPQAMFIRFDCSFQGNSNAITDAVIFQLGSGYSNNSNTEINSNTYAQFGINTLASGGQFNLRNITSNQTSPTTFTSVTISDDDDDADDESDDDDDDDENDDDDDCDVTTISMTQFTWVINNTANTLNYIGPNGIQKTLATDRMDVWVGTTLVFNSTNVQTAAGSPNHFKIIYKGTNGMKMFLDNFRINSPSDLFPGGNYTIGNIGNFRSFTNSGGIFQEMSYYSGISGNVNLRVVSDINGETGSFSLPQLAGMDQFQVAIRPNNTITRTISSATTVNANGMFCFNGADNILIDGRAPTDVSEGFSTNKRLVFVNNHTGSPVIQFRNGSVNGIVKFCNIQGASNNVNQGLLQVGDASSSHANRDILFDYNLITRSTGAAPRYGIHITGTAMRETRNISITNNEIIDIYTPSSSSGYIAIGDNLRMLRIQNNHLYQNTPGTSGNSATYVSIIGGKSGGNSNNCDSIYITNNFIGGRARFTLGQAWTMTTSSNMPMRIRGIDIRIPATSTAFIEGNVINNINMTFTRTNNTNEYSFRGIFINQGKAFVRNNRIGTRDSLVFTSSASNTAGGISALGIEFNGAEGIVENNIVQGMVGAVTGGGDFGIDITGIRVGATGIGVQIRNNTIGHRSQLASLRTRNTSKKQTVTGILSVSNGNNIADIYGNYISGLCDSSTNWSSSVRGIIHSGSAGIVLRNDTICNLQSFSASDQWGTNQGAVGVLMLSHTGEANIYNNLIHSISSSSATSVASHTSGIVSAATGTTKIYGNRIYNLINRSTYVNPQGPYVSGINTGDKEVGGQLYIYNNMITLGITPNGTNNAQKAGLIGIWHGNDTRNQNVQISYNTVYIGGTESGASNATYAFFRGNNWNINIPSPLYIQNNIFCNARIGVSRHIGIGSELTTPSITASNNNAIFATTANNTTRWGNNFSNLIGWQSATSRDQNSLYENIAAVSPTQTACFSNVFTSAATADLHVPQCEIRINSKGMVITTPFAITTDIDGEFRRGTDIGADEVFNIKTFTGTASVDWNNDANWDYKQKPTCADSIIIAAFPSTTATPAGNVSVVRAPTMTAGQQAFFKGIDIKPSATLTMNGNSNLEGCWFDGLARIRGTLTQQNSVVSLAGHLEIVGTLNSGTSHWIMNNDSSSSLWSNNNGLRNFMANYNAQHDTIQFKSIPQIVELNSLTVANAGKMNLVGHNNMTLKLKSTGIIRLNYHSELITNNRHIDLYGTIDPLAEGTIVSDASTRLRVNGSANVIGYLKFKSGHDIVKSLRLNRNTQGSVRLGSSLTVLDSLVMNAGILYTSNSNLLTVGENAKLIGFGSANNYIDGPVMKQFKSGSSEFLFPVGKNGRFRPVNAVNEGGNALTAEYFDIGPGASFNTNNVDGNPMEVKNLEHWIIRPPAPAPGQSAIFTFNWGPESGITEQNNIMMRLRIAAWQSDKEQWKEIGPMESNAGGSAFEGSITADETNLFGPFTFGILDNASLPVELLEFSATPAQEDVLVKWTTVSEINNDFFEVYRSKDAVQFTPIGRVNGSGNANHIIKYELLDPMAARQGADVLYYRLRQVDFNGEFSDSEIVPVQFEQSGSFQLVHASFEDGKGLSGAFTNNSKGQVQIFCFDMNGRLILQQTIQSNEGINSFNVATDGMARGVYTVQVVYNGTAHAAKVPKSF